jgi:4'-phosphopantetheinyl transferase
MAAIPPPLKSWSGTLQNRCAFDEIPAYWQKNDVITFLVDPGIYHPSLYDFLTHSEKEQERGYKPVISRQRFIVSRTILKHILREILSKEHVADVVLVRNIEGRIFVKDHPSVFISLSYSGTSIAITVGKWKLGSDIEVVRPVHDKKITSSPIFNDMNCTDGKERTRRVIHVWTLVEACAKLHDLNPYPLLNNRSLFEDVNFVSYCINQHSIFSLASGPDQFTDALVWLDTSVRGKSSCSGNKGMGRLDFFVGNMHVHT